MQLSGDRWRNPGDKRPDYLSFACHRRLNARLKEHCGIPIAQQLGVPFEKAAAMPAKHPDGGFTDQYATFKDAGAALGRARTHVCNIVNLITSQQLMRRPRARSARPVSRDAPDSSMDPRRSTPTESGYFAGWTRLTVPTIATVGEPVEAAEFVRATKIQASVCRAVGECLRP